MTMGMKSLSAATTRPGGRPGGRAILLALALVASAGAAHAQNGHSLRDALFGSRGASDTRRAAPPAVARYVSETGSAFILDRGASQPLMKFENSSEVWVLSAQPAPRGDTIYKNEMGEPVLRASKLGGMTLFTAERPAGDAAALTGKATSIQPPTVISVNLLFQRLLQASARASRAAQHRIAFETVDDATPATSVLVADTATVTAEAFEKMARNGDRNLLARVVRVLLAEGRKPGVNLKGSDLIVTYAPDKGLSGRPSSKRIIKIVNR
ncbi:MAG: DUF4908 domain-containing protein [Gemmatimonadaceae bacterium]|nr:DUF4908 domain-containing protein [Caulobacter sp.]